MESVAYEELLQQDGKVITHVVGSSMVPLLHNRESIVVVEAVDHVPPHKGDVVLYKTGDTYILHRILQEKEEEYLIRGDNTWMLEHVPKRAVLGTRTDFYRHPEGRLVSRDDAAYHVYQSILPAIRLFHRIGSKGKRVILNAGISLNKSQEPD